MVLPHMFVAKLVDVGLLFSFPELSFGLPGGGSQFEHVSATVA